MKNQTTEPKQKSFLQKMLKPALIGTLLYVTVGATALNIFLGENGAFHAEFTDKPAQVATDNEQQSDVSKEYLRRSSVCMDIADYDLANDCLDYVSEQVISEYNEL